MENFSLQLELLTGGIKLVKKQIETLEKSRRRDISLSVLKKIQKSPRKIGGSKAIITSTPKATTVKVRVNRHKSKLSRFKNLKNHKTKNSTATDTDTIAQSIDASDCDSDSDSDSNSDCEVVEQPSDLIVLDEDSNASSSASETPEENSCPANSTEDSSSTIQNPEFEAEPAIADDSSCLFYEDKEPSINFAVPLYESVSCVLVDSNSTETTESTATPSTDTMPRLFTVQNEHYNRSDGKRVPVKDRLGYRYPKIDGDSTIDATTPEAIPIATPSVPKMNVRVLVEPTEKAVSTRTCIITSSSADSSDASSPASTANNESMGKVLQIRNDVTNTEARPQPKPLQITFTNKNVPSTSATVTEAGKGDGDSPIIAENGCKRRRKDSDVILIDETTSENHRDDSVIFVSESVNTGRPLVPIARKRKGGPLIGFGGDYIPVASGKRESPRPKLRKTKSTRAQRKTDKKVERRQALLEKSRQQQPSTSKAAQATNNNNDGEKKDSRDPNKLEKRMIIIDGSNVAFGHGFTQFSVKGIELCLNYFLSRGFEAKAVVPQMRTQRDRSTDPKRLDELHKQEKVVFTPCKNLPGKKAISYDDRIILDIASNFDAAIISNDNYKDLINTKPEWDEIIKNRVIGFTFFNDLIVFPSDPYGRQGLSLTEILYKPKGGESESKTDEKKSD